MKLPVIKNLVEFIQNNDEDYILETIEVHKVLEILINDQNDI